MAKDCPYYEAEKQNPFRAPDWRWRRACDLVESGKYFSTKRDDEETGIVVGYLRDLRRCLSELRIKRVEKRYRHLHRARQIFERGSASRLEIQARILARQIDAEIAYHVGLQPAAVQAYRDIYFMVDDRLDATSYIMFRIIGMTPLDPPTPTMLMQMSAYLHGPHTIEPWLEYLSGEVEADLRSPAGRDGAAIELLVAAHSAPRKTAPVAPATPCVDTTNKR